MAYSKDNLPQGFYVYQYIREDGTPYYIGKGKGARLYDTSKRTIRAPKNKDRIIIVQENLSEELAFKLEKELIAKYGRKNNQTGILRNLTDGGEGSSGTIWSIEQRKKISIANKNRSPELLAKIKQAIQESRTPEVGAKISAANKNRSPEINAKISAANKGRKPWNKGLTYNEDSRIKRNFNRKVSEETRAKLSNSLKGKSTGKKHSPETIEKLKKARAKQIFSDETRAKLRGRKLSDETRAKISSKLKGRKHSDESRAKMRGRKHSDETRTKMRGRIHNKETRAKISCAVKNRKVSQETRLKMSAARKLYVLKNQTPIELNPDLFEIIK